MKKKQEKELNLKKKRKNEEKVNLYPYLKTCFIHSLLIFYFSIQE